MKAWKNRLGSLARLLFSGRSTVIGIPYAFLLLFFLLPFFIVFKISVSQMETVTFKDILTLSDGVLQFTIKLSNYVFITEDALYYKTYIASLKYAAATTLLCLGIGYPFAYFMARARTTVQPALLMLVMLPFWTSFLIRIYAWIGILKNNGLLNNFLIWTGLIDEPLKILHTPVAVYIGIVYAYLPFMILPLYTNLVKHDHRLLEAAYDLGCRPWQAFLRITLPLSKAGIIAGSMLVMIPAVGEFVIPELMGGADTLMIGRQLWVEFFNNRDWPVASAVAIVMLVLLIVPILIFHHYQSKELEGRLA